MLAGLVPVAVSINLERILAVAGLAGRAGESLVMFLSVLVLGVFVLVPQSEQALGIELLVAGLVILAGLLVIAIPGVRATPHQPLAWRITRVVAAIGAGLPAVAAGASLIADMAGSLYWLAGSFVVSFVAGVGNAWVQAPGHRVTYLPCNHDAEVWSNPDVRRALDQAGLVGRYALSYSATFASRLDRAVYSEHGNQFDPANALTDYCDPLDTPLGAHVVAELARPIGAGAAVTLREGGCWKVAAAAALMTLRMYLRRHIVRSDGIHRGRWGDRGSNLRSRAGVHISAAQTGESRVTPSSPRDPMLADRVHAQSLLTGLLARLSAGAGGILVLEGPPGIGKTRLLAETLGLARSSGVTT